MATINSIPPMISEAQTRWPMQLRLGLNLALLASWLWLYHAVFDYLAIIFTREDFRTNQIVLGGVLLLIVLRIRKSDFSWRFDTLPQQRPLPLAITLICSGIYLLAERFLDINTLSAVLFGLGSYGLLGLWLPVTRWREGLPAALLLIGVLPFGEHMQTFIGYPLRIFTASLVRDGLTAVGIPSLGVDTILIFENGVSQVDSPCSGVKSLWTGMLFLLAATWLEKRPLRPRWLFVTVIFILLLLISNLSRVAILVLVGQVAGWTLLAEIIHVPLGVLGFVFACAAAVLMLRGSGENSHSVKPRRTHRTSNWFAPTLIVGFCLMALFYTSRPQTGLAQTPPTWNFPAEMQSAPLPLKPDELAWLTRDGADSADRRSFAWRGLSGSMILISSHTWRAHHRPERCFEVYGLSLDDSRAHLVTPDFPIRFVTLSDGDDQNKHAATYWFQSADQTTDDYGTRIWADVAPQRDQWVLISILFAEKVDPNDADVQALYLALHEAVAQR